VKYSKTREDKDREKHDMEQNPIMRYLKFKDHFKFTINDVLIKKTRPWYGEAEWEIEKYQNGAPKKYMYVFENEVGIGYLKQLCVDGKTFAKQLICTANFDPEYTKFEVDPDFVDNILIGDEDKAFQYNKAYLDKKQFRDEAMKKNKLLLVHTGTLIKTYDWFNSLKVGDVFWCGYSWDDVMTCSMQVTDIKDDSLKCMPHWLLDRLGGNILNAKQYTKIYRGIRVKILTDANQSYIGQINHFTGDHFLNWKISMQPLHPLTDALA